MDNLINDKIDLLIMNSMKAHNNVRTETLRAMKSAFLNWKTAKENIGKTLDEASETQILKKMVKQRQESMEQYMNAGRPELADYEKAQMDIIVEFLPAPVTEDDIVRVFLHVRENEGVEPEKKNMGVFVKRIKELLPGADGKMVADVVKNNLN